MKTITQKGIWVSSSFTEKFGSKDIKPSKTVPDFKKLECNMYDKEIKKKLGAEECTLADVVAFLKNPPKGTDDGYANLFYVAGYVVYVGWDAVSREWEVSAWRLDDDDWSAGLRVFSRNWNFETKETDLGTSDALTLRIEKLESQMKRLGEALINKEN